MGRPRTLDRGGMVVQAPPPSLLANGVALMRERKFAAARDVLSPALTDAPPKYESLLPLGYCLLGDAEVALHDDEAARRAYERAMDLAGEGAENGAAAVGAARCDARLGRHRAAAARLRRAVSRRAVGLAPSDAAAAAVEAAAASVRAGDCAVAVRWLGAVLKCDARRLALDERDRSNAGALLALLRLRSGDLDAAAAGRALAECSGNSLLARFAARQIPRRLGGGAPEAADDDFLDGESRFLERVALNACCLHSPAWAELDDKLGLHRALGGARAPWWPPSFEVPRERAALEAADDATSDAGPRWVLKSARGYGGGSVRFLPTARDVPPAATGVVQQYVAPPLLLKGGRRATLRVYVVVLGTRSFVSRDGLVRFAARVYDGRADDAAQHLTNGAQAALAATAAGDEGAPAGDFADEHLDWLEDALGSATFERITWPRVVDAATTVVALAAEQESEPLWPHAALPLALPKIIGLDFALAAGGVPYLLELNRTPGLAPRGPADSAAKHAVVEAAWSNALWRGDEEAAGAVGLVEIE